MMNSLLNNYFSINFIRYCYYTQYFRYFTERRANAA